MKKANRRFRSVLTIFLLAVFCTALFSPTATAEDLFDWDTYMDEDRDVADEHPWADNNDPYESGSFHMLVRLPLLLMDVGLIDNNGYTQLDSKSSNNCLKQDADEDQDFDPIR